MSLHAHHAETAEAAASVPSQSAATVYVVDDEPFVQDVVTAVLRSAGLRAESFGTAQAFLEACRPDEPGCILLDLRLPDMAGTDLLAELQRRRIRLPVVIVTGYGDVPTARDLLKAGAVDFIPKPFDASQLLAAVRTALAVEEESRRRSAELADIETRLARLTKREREVLDLVVDGVPNKGIAGRLGIAERTVEDHRARVMKKMGTAHLAELLRMVLSFRAARSLR